MTLSAFLSPPTHSHPEIVEEIVLSPSSDYERSPAEILSVVPCPREPQQTSQVGIKTFLPMASRCRGSGREVSHRPHRHINVATVVLTKMAILVVTLKKMSFQIFQGKNTTDERHADQESKD